MNDQEHPCDICPRVDCDINCVFYRYYSGHCQNYDCIYHNSDIDCQFAKRCGSYIGKAKSELDFDEEEES